MIPWKTFSTLFSRKPEPDPEPAPAPSPPWTYAQQWHVFDWSDSEFSHYAGLFWVKQAIPVARDVHALTFKAVEKWAEQAGQTPDEWLKEWAPVIEPSVEGEALTFRVVPQKRA